MLDHRDTSPSEYNIIARQSDSSVMRGLQWAVAVMVEAVKVRNWSISQLFFLHSIVIGQFLILTASSTAATVHWRPRITVRKKRDIDTPMIRSRESEGAAQLDFHRNQIKIKLEIKIHGFIRSGCGW